MQQFNRTSIRTFFSKEFVQGKTEQMKGYILARKSLSFYPVFLLYGLSIVFLIKLTQILLG